MELVMAGCSSQYTLIKSIPERIKALKLAALFKNTLSGLFQEQ